MPLLVRLCRYLQEWLEYHLLLGVGRFILVPNECEEAEWRPYEELLAPYVAAGTVEVMEDFRCERQFQREAYNVAYRHIQTRGIARWWVSGGPALLFAPISFSRATVVAPPRAKAAPIHRYVLISHAVHTLESTTFGTQLCQSHCPS